MVAEIGAIGDDDVVEEVDAHEAAGLLDAAGQVVIVLTGAEVARGMVVADSEDGGIVHHRLAHDQPDIDTHLGDATTGDTRLTDQALVLIH